MKCGSARRTVWSISGLRRERARDNPRISVTPTPICSERSAQHAIPVPPSFFLVPMPSPCSIICTRSAAALQPAPTPFSRSTRPAGTQPASCRFRQTSASCTCRLQAPNSIRLRTSGNTCVRPISRTECSVTTTMWSRLRARPGISSLPSQAGLHQSARDAGRPSVKVRDDWYYFWDPATQQVVIADMPGHRTSSAT